MARLHTLSVQKQPSNRQTQMSVTEMRNPQGLEIYVSCSPLTVQWSVDQPLFLLPLLGSLSQRPLKPQISNRLSSWHSVFAMCKSSCETCTQDPGSWVNQFEHQFGISTCQTHLEIECCFNPKFDETHQLNSLDFVASTPQFWWWAPFSLGKHHIFLCQIPLVVQNIIDSVPSSVIICKFENPQIVTKPSFKIFFDGYNMLQLIWLVVYLPLWKIRKSMGRIIPYIVENKKCLKPPASHVNHVQIPIKEVNISQQWSSPHRRSPHLWQTLLLHLSFLSNRLLPCHTIWPHLMSSELDRI